MTRKIGLDDGGRGAAAERDDVAFDQQPLAAADHGDDEREHRGLRDADPEVLFGGRLPESAR